MLLQADLAGSLAGFWTRNGDAIESLGIYAGGILAYALIVNTFYQVISKRVMFAGKTVDGEVRVGGPGRGFLYLMLFPLVSFLFFLLLSLSLLFLGGENQTTDQVITLSFAVVAAVRIAAYFSEPTSHDVAKMLPLGLLGVILVQAEFQSLRESVAQLRAFFDHVDLVALYFGVVVVLEYALRSFYLAVGHRPRKRTPPEPVRPAAPPARAPREAARPARDARPAQRP